LEDKTLETEKFNHELDVIYAIRYLKSKFKDTDIEVDTRFLDHFSFCPRCRSDLKIYNNTLKGLVSVSCYLLLEQNKVILYGICKKCAKALVNPIKQNSNTNETENNIVSVLPDLKRKSVDYTKEERKKEFTILNNL
jgi:hypothetical protein